MSYDFTISLLVFTIIMLLFNIIKDFVIFKGIKPTIEFKKRANRRWILSYIAGLIFLYLLYG